MKIAIDIRLIGKKRTGDEAVFFNLVKNLSLLDRANEYILLTDRSPEYDALLAEEIGKLNLAENFTVVSLREKGVNRYFWNAFVLPKYLRAHPVDILQTQYITPFFVPKKIKIITIVHDVSFKAYPELVRKTDLFFLDILIPLSLKRADKIIGVSQFTAHEIIRYYGVDPRKVDWVHNAVGDNFKLEISGNELEEVRKKYNLPQKFILYIGTLQPRKNIPALIEAFVKIPIEKRKDLKLVLAGGRGYNFDQRIEKYIQNYSLQDFVFLPGFIDEKDKPALFKAAHIFCSPSLYEGFGIPILEAMTLGVPTLASNIPPHIELAEDAILFFDAKNPADFSEKLTRLVSDDSLRLQLEKSGQLHAQKFSWQKTAAKMLAIYNDLLGIIKMIDE